jgi:putative methyltransferase (TIGR04325 family)
MNQNIIWNGIYDSFPLVNHTKKAFSQKRWIQKQCKEATEIYLNKDLRISQTILGKIIIGYTAKNCQQSTIVDFGGGLALEYLRLISSGYQVEELDYYVIETEAVCNFGQTYYSEKEFPNFLGLRDQIHFKSNLEELDMEYDIFHCDSSFQYIEDWRTELEKVFLKSPSLILLCGMLAGDIPTFATVQNYYEQQLPVWFINKQEIVKFLHENNYRLVFQEKAESRYFGEVRNLPMSNFPIKYQLQKKCHLCFRLQK